MSAAFTTPALDIEHKLPTGLINIHMEPCRENADRDMFTFDYVNTISEKSFSGSLTRYVFQDECPLLYEPDKLIATLMELPKIEETASLVIVRLEVAGRKKAYSIEIVLYPITVRKVDIERLAAVKLENSELRKQIAILEARISAADAKNHELENNIATIAHLLTTNSQH